MTGQRKLEVQGIVQRHPIPEILVEINQIRLDGSLRITNRDQKVIIYVEKGNIAFAVSNAREHRLFTILLAQGRVENKHLAGIDDFTNDFKLSHALVSKGLLSEEEIGEFFRFQIRAIVSTVIGWKTGNWVFSPLARLKDGLRYDVDLRSALFESSHAMTDYEILARFKSLEESFALNTNVRSSTIPFSPQEAFVLSRLDEHPLKIEEIKTISGLAGNEVMPILYRLWLGGFIFRDHWNKAFTKEAVDRFRNTKVYLKQSAKSVEGEERIKQEEARKAAEEEERKRREQEEKQRIAEEKREKERREFQADYKEVEISVEDYLTLVEEAPTYYELFGIEPDAKPATIKRAYFSFARRFHPDVFHKKVEPELHRRIQKAFTEIAQAYETLRHEDSRELYNMKLERVIDALKKKHDGDLGSLTRDEVARQDRSRMAMDSFERGKRLLEDGYYEDAGPHLGRAVQLEDSNAEYRAFYGLALSKEKRNRHKAEAELKAAVNLAPSEPKYRLMLVELYVEIGLSVRARNELKRLLEKDPENRRAKELLEELGEEN
ncbi:MAG: DnaJ domain-containing protein [Acidobacteriota bacterium]|nr:MAG: DnaJ domain-containing protein [Acidobacteriota bacterium]